MRIIRILVMLPLVWMISVPQNVQAANIASNETQINLKIKGDEKLFSKLLNYNQPSKMEIALYNLRKDDPVITPEEKERELKLARFKEKLDSAKLPNGKFAINASAYTAAADECGKSDGITASGVKVMENRTLACPPMFPFGAKVRIEGMGTYVCEDRGGAIKGNHFDIYMQTKKQAFTFGRRILLAEVVK